MSDFELWDGKDIDKPTVLSALLTGEFGLVVDHKLKTPNSDKPLRVHKKVEEGVYEIIREVNGRNLVRKGDLMGIFPIDSHALKTKLLPEVKAVDLQKAADKVKAEGGYGLVAYIMEGTGQGISRSIHIRIIAGNDTIAVNDD